jgi:hypothetical protein
VPATLLGSRTSSKSGVEHTADVDARIETNIWMQALKVASRNVEAMVSIYLLSSGAALSRLGAIPGLIHLRQSMRAFCRDKKC